MTATGAFDLVTTAVEALSGLANVYDGPPLTQDEPATYVIIGGQGWADDDDQPAWTTDAEWRSVPIGAGSREESVSIPCEVTAWSGSDTWAACPVNLGPMTLTNVQVVHQLLDPGMAVRVLFTIDARIHL